MLSADHFTATEEIFNPSIHKTSQNNQTNFKIFTVFAERV